MHYYVTIIELGESVRTYRRDQFGWTMTDDHGQSSITPELVLQDLLHALRFDKLHNIAVISEEDN